MVSPLVLSIKDPKWAKLYWTLVQARYARWPGCGLKHHKGFFHVRTNQAYHLALIDGDIGHFDTAQKVAELAIKKFRSIDAVVANGVSAFQQ
jgi:hypothetical protein